MASGTPPTSLRQMLEAPLAQLSGQVERLFDEARGRARRELADQLNQAARRMRLADSVEELAATLVDAAAVFATGVALFRIEGDTAFGAGIRAVPEQAAWSFGVLEIPLDTAPALGSAIDTRDPVTALGSAAELSPGFAAMLEHAVDARVQIFPVVAGDEVPALLCAWGSVQNTALELLVQVAAAEWKLPPPPPPALPEPLIAIAPAPAPIFEDEPRDSSAGDMPLADEPAHLRAQRFARVQVAGMRLQEATAVQSGRAARNLYAALKTRIDAARVTYRDSFCASCPSMKDYLHAELVRTLAQDDAELLGKDYPGPLV